MRRRSSFILPRRPDKIEACANFWPRAVLTAAADDALASLDHLERDFESVHSADLETRIGIRVLHASAILSIECAHYVATIGELPPEVRADVLGVAARFLTAQRRSIERVRDSMRA